MMSNRIPAYCPLCYMAFPVADTGVGSLSPAPPWPTSGQGSASASPWSPEAELVLNLAPPQWLQRWDRLQHTN